MYTISMADDEPPYTLVLGKPWWLCWHRADDIVLGNTAYCRIKRYLDGSLASPSAGHLAHMASHVTEFRRDIKPGPLSMVRWIVHWFRNGKALEMEADTAAAVVVSPTVSTTKTHWIQEWEKLRRLVGTS